MALTPEELIPFAQASAQFIQSRFPTGARRNAMLSVALGEPCAPERLRAAWETVAPTALGMTIQKGPAGEIIARPPGTAPCQILDWAAVPPADLGGRWAAMQAEELARPIALNAPPLVRCTVIGLPGGFSHILVVFPNAVLDDAAVLGLLGRWLLALDGVVTPVPQIPETSISRAETLEWWSERFADAAAPVELKEASAGAPSRATLRLDAGQSESVRALAERAGAAPSDVFLSVFAHLLGRLGGTRDVVFLAQAASNILPARIALDPAQSAEEFARSVAKIDRVERADISLERAIGLLRPSRGMGDFSSAFFWSPPAPGDVLRELMPRWMNADVKLDRPTSFALTLEVRDDPRYHIELSSGGALNASLLLDRFLSILAQFLNNPATGAVKLLTGDEEEVLKPRDVPLPDGPGFIEALAGRDPEAIAVIGAASETDALAFRDLISHSESIARYLRAENLAGGWVIAVCLTPTSWLPVSVFGVVQAGSVALPLDCRSPAEFLNAQVARFDAELILCDSGTAPFFADSSRRILVIDQQWEQVTAAPVSETTEPPTKAAFLIPSANALTLPATFVTSCAAQLARTLGLKAGDRIPLLASAGTAGFVETLVASAISGATLILPGGTDLLSSVKAATHTVLSSGRFRTLALEWNDQSGPEAPEVVVVLGDPVLPVSLPNSRVLRLSPPTELGGIAFESTNLAALGMPQPGLVARLDDCFGQPLPPRIVGTISQDIPCLADHWRERGVANAPVSGWRDEMGIFFPDPPKERLVEDFLRTLAGVRDAFVAPLPGAEAAKTRLGAWVVTANAEWPQGLREKIRDGLPASIRPETVEVVSALPLDENGKLDVSEIVAPVPSAPPVVPAQSPEIRATAVRLTEWEPLVLLAPAAGAPILCCVHDFEGTADRYGHLATALQGDWAIYATTARGVARADACHSSVEAEAAALIESLCNLDPQGAYHLFGHGYGAVLAFEMARQLRRAGREVSYLVLAGPAHPPAAGWMRSLSRLIAPFTESRQDPVADAHRRALGEYLASPLAGPAGILLGMDQSRDVRVGWSQLLPDAPIETMDFPASEMLGESGARRMAVILREWAVAGAGDGE